jgi:hypothetical protein
METLEKIDFGFKNEIFSQQNPLFNFAQRIKQLSSQNFIVEWQLGENHEREVLGEQVYGMII